MRSGLAQAFEDLLAFVQEIDRRRLGETLAGRGRLAFGGPAQERVIEGHEDDQMQARRVDESYDVRGIAGHASHPEVLERAGARDADMLVAVTRSDEVNMVACQVAHSLFGVKRRIARLRHHGYLEPKSRGLYGAAQLPIDVVISPEVEVARGIVRVPVCEGYWELKSIDDGRRTLATYVLKTDPGGMIPKWMSEAANSRALPDVFKSLATELAKQAVSAPAKPIEKPAKGLAEAEH